MVPLILGNPHVEFRDAGFAIWVWGTAFWAFGFEDHGYPKP